VFVFLTISKFGALNCALIGLGRKILSLLLSFVLYAHVLNASQMVGLALSLAAMVANFYEKVRLTNAPVRAPGSRLPSRGAGRCRALGDMHE
jgi:drug/metabolite transporter (DMT)-like permease